MISRIPIAAQKKGEAFRPLPAYAENGRLVLEDGILGFVFLHQLEQHRAEQQDGDQVRDGALQVSASSHTTSSCVSTPTGMAMQ